MYKIDLHVHTAETSPCGRIGARELVHLYRGQGYHGVVITDHYFKEYFDSLGDIPWEDKVDHFLSGYRLALDEARSTGFSVYLGMEIRFEENYNDYLVYGIDESFLRRHPKLYSLGLEKFKKLAEENGLLIYQAHPFRPWIVPIDPACLDGVEIYNGNPRHDSRNHLAREFAMAHKLRVISGSDFHQLEDLARGGILTSRMPADEKELMEILLNCKESDLIIVE